MKKKKDIQKTAEAFRKWSELEDHGITGLYRGLSKAISEDPDILEIASQKLPGQPAPNILFAAVHFLLLKGLKHPLARYYPTIAKEADLLSEDEKLVPAFRDFCRKNAKKLAPIVGSRRTQTNEINRSALLMPVFSKISSRNPEMPFHMVELGPSAGFNMAWDRYAYDYGTGRLYGDPSAAIQLTSTFREGIKPELIENFHETVAISSKIGIELRPVDLFNPDEVLWLQALVFPHHLERMNRLRKAIQFAKENRPNIVEGNVVELLPGVLENLSAGALPVVYHSFVLYQFNDEDRGKVFQSLEKIGKERDLYRVAIEWMGTETPYVKLDLWEGGKHRELELARCNPHGRWIEWKAGSQSLSP